METKEQRKSVDWSNVAEAAKLCAGNHREIKDFAWFNRPDDADRYYLWYISNRDSTLVTESNASVITKEMLKCPGAYEERHNHWACGYVDAIIVPVYRKDGKTITKAFKVCCKLNKRLEDYTLLDEQDHSTREYEATLTNIKNEGKRFVLEDVPKDWPEQVYSWYSDQDCTVIENKDDQGAWLDDDELKVALEDLHFLHPQFSLNQLEDFLIDSKVIVSKPYDKTNKMWKSEFTAWVKAHEEDTFLVVENVCGQRYRVYPGEVKLWSLSNDDPQQHQLFYFLGGFKSWEDMIELREGYSKLEGEES